MNPEGVMYEEDKSQAYMEWAAFLRQRDSDDLRESHQSRWRKFNLWRLKQGLKPIRFSFWYRLIRPVE